MAKLALKVSKKSSSFLSATVAVKMSKIFIEGINQVSAPIILWLVASVTEAGIGVFYFLFIVDNIFFCFKYIDVDFSLFCTGMLLALNYDRGLFG